MRYKILQRLDAEDNLALLLNAYMKPLFMLEQVALPRESMHAFRHLLDSAAGDTPTEEAQQRLHWAAPRLYHLCVLDNSLTDLHKNVGWAIAALTKFFNDYDGDLQRYAIENRLGVLDEFGSDEDEDWVETGEFNEEGKPTWKPSYKDDEKSLAPYTLRAELRQYFVDDDAQGEKIGASHPEDFAYFSNQVHHATEFCPLKFLRTYTGGDLPVYRENDEGEMVALSLGDEVEAELNEDLRNQTLVVFFNKVLEQCNHAAALETFATSSEHYRELLTTLEAIRDVQL